MDIKEITSKKEYRITNESERSYRPSSALYVVWSKKGDGWQYEEGFGGLWGAIYYCKYYGGYKSEPVLTPQGGHQVWKFER